MPSEQDEAENLILQQAHDRIHQGIVEGKGYEFTPEQIALIRAALKPPADSLEKLKADNERMRKALTLIAEPKHWGKITEYLFQGYIGLRELQWFGVVLPDEIARKALEDCKAPN